MKLPGWARIVLEIIIVVGCIFAIIIPGFNYLMNNLVHQKEDVVVPDLRNKPVVEVLDILNRANLSLQKEGEQFNSRIPPNCVISQNPSPGSIVKEGRTVKVILSKGGEKVFVPDVTNKSIQEAQIILKQNKLVIGEEVRIYSNNVARNFIISQDPLPSEIVSIGTPVNLIVSLGPSLKEGIKMPSLIGENIYRVQWELEEIGLAIGNIKYIIKNDIPEGTILKQEPLPGDLITAQTVVSLTVSKKEE